MAQEDNFAKMTGVISNEGLLLLHQVLLNRK